MSVNKEAYKNLQAELSSKKITLVAVSKTKPVEEIKELYDLGQRDFGENYVQELVEKEQQLPKDIRWHFIGHLQTNKVKSIIPFVQLIQSVDSFKLLKEINKQAVKVERVVNCLLEVHIAEEESKFGFDEQELQELNELHELKNVRIVGLMGMASLTHDIGKIKEEFKKLRGIFNGLTTHDSRLTTLSMGMTADYTIAVEEGSTMVRIGSMLFGERVKG